MPPRLLNAGGRYGSAGLTDATVIAREEALAGTVGDGGAGVTVTSEELAAYTFTDTLRSDSGAWSFDSGPVDQISNQYAAMPSLHVAWAAWCAFVIIACSRRRWLRWLALAHPVITLVAIVSTANHYFLDAVGGLAVLGLGCLGAAAIERAAAWRNRQSRTDVLTMGAMTDA
jgi:membrane-associated phospholipid phosphatase